MYKGGVTWPRDQPSKAPRPRGGLSYRQQAERRPERGGGLLSVLETAAPRLCQSRTPLLRVSRLGVNSEVGASVFLGETF